MSQIQHIVLFKIKPDVTTEKVTELFRLLAQLQQLIPGITYSPVEHTQHERFKAALLPCIDDALAFDFEG